MKFINSPDEIDIR